MEKTNKHKSLFLKFLPKAAASAVNFQSTPFSPGRDHHHNYHHSSTKLKSHANKGFSGPINFAALPDEARRKPTNANGGYDSIEPTSPKVSCMGQIKCKHKKKILLKTAKDNHVSSTKSSRDKISKFFSMKSPKNKHSKKSSTNCSKVISKGSDVDENSKMMPSLGQMRKFASGRESLGNFDWMAQIAPIDHDRDCYSDEERRRDSDEDDEDEDEDEREVIIPFSAPILVGGRSGEMLNNFEKRKEVCLWKRRTMNPPPPLALKSTR